MHSALASFKVFINGNVANAAYNSQLAESSISPSFCRINQISYHLGVCNTTVSIETSTGEYFTCAIKLRISEKFSKSDPYDFILGRDWFNLSSCSTGLEDNPEAAVHLSSLNQWLIFAVSPVNAIHSQILPSSKFHSFNDCNSLISESNTSPRKVASSAFSAFGSPSKRPHRT